MQSQREHFGVIVIGPAGKIPFFAGGDFIDELGLNDPDLARIRRARFVPGHSAGGLEPALQLAAQHPAGVYSLFLFNGSLKDLGPEVVALYINNRSPQEGVQTTVTERAWLEASTAIDPRLWSAIVHPVPAASQ
jgi:hypothetical protein